jgi:MarR family
VGSTVPATTRETVESVRALALSKSEGVTVADVAADLRLDRSAAQRRLQSARERGYVVNLEERRGRPARYRPEQPMPDEQELLPSLAQRTALEDETAGRAGVCSSAAPAEEIYSPSETDVRPDDPATPMLAELYRRGGWARIVREVHAAGFRQPDGQPYSTTTARAAFAVGSRRTWPRERRSHDAPPRARDSG